MSELKTEIANLYQPSLEELVPVLASGLQKNFRNVQVKVVECPKLNEAPFHLAAEGLCGKTSIADVGGVPYLLPFAKVDRPQYKFEDVFKAADLPSGLLVGAGAGPHQNVGINCEMAANVRKTQDGLINESRICKTEQESYKLMELKYDEFALLANFFCSQGKPGPVLEIIASDRIGKTSFPTTIRQTLADQYKDKSIGLGGPFLIEKGKAKIHVMPLFSKTALNTDADVEAWLKFFEMDAPLICLGELVSKDPGLDLRVEHFHCFSNHGDGGHYHYDTTPDSVVYRAYFNVAEKIVRIDRPEETHQIGRD